MSLKRHQGRPTKAEEAFYAAWAKIVDALPLDTVLRMKKADAPGESWIRDRCLLNQCKVIIKTHHSDWVIIRIQ